MKAEHRRTRPGRDESLDNLSNPRNSLISQHEDWERVELAALDEIVALDDKMLHFFSHRPN